MVFKSFVQTCLRSNNVNWLAALLNLCPRKLINQGPGTWTLDFLKLWAHISLATEWVHRQRTIVKAGPEQTRNYHKPQRLIPYPYFFLCLNRQLLKTVDDFCKQFGSRWDPIIYLTLNFISAKLLKSIFRFWKKEKSKKIIQHAKCRAPDKMRKLNFNRHYLRYIFTKTYVWPLVLNIVLTRQI